MHGSRFVWKYIVPFIGEEGMAEVLTFPLTPVPLALSHADGTMQKTPKLKHFESKIESTSPTTIDLMPCFFYTCKEIYQQRLEEWQEAFCQGLYNCREKKFTSCVTSG